MPKPPLRDNPQSSRAVRRPTRSSSKPIEIKDLLARHGLATEAAKNSAATLPAWEARWRALAPPDLAAAVRQVRLRRGTLVFYVSSASWASRLRYQLPVCWSALIEGQAPMPSGWRVQIQPAAASTGERA